MAIFSYSAHLCSDKYYFGILTSMNIAIVYFTILSNSFIVLNKSSMSESKGFLS